MASKPISALPAGYRTDPYLGAVYDSIPETADDLTVIRGIETHEAAGLNQLGVYYYEQLAGWTDTQTVAIADAMGISASSIFRDRWTDQALVLSTPESVGHESLRLSKRTPSLAASGSRTVAVLIGALLIGCFFVAWLNRGNQPPMSGVLTAEITALRVPADGRLLATHVTAGDEVFTGEILLTLEKTEHLQQIASQARRVQELTQHLRKAEAQASIELQWRSQQLQQELSDVKRRAAYLNEFRIASENTDLSQATSKKSARAVQTVSRLRSLQPQRSNGLLFINGVSGASATSGQVAPRATTGPAQTAMKPAPGIPNDDRLLRLEAASVQSRLQQLERIRTSLPTQIKKAAGVDSLQAQLADARGRLTHMESLNRETAILCPGYGTVGQVRYQEGDRVANGDVLVRILHTDRCYVMVHAPSNRIAELQPGTHVTVLFPEHDRCEGIVAGLPVIAEKPLTGGASMAAIRVESVGRHWPELPVGSSVQVVTD